MATLQESRQKVQIMGTDGTAPLDLAVCSSGEVVICSGLHVVADIAESGMHVWISGQHVYVESGVHVVAGLSLSGLDIQVDISGDPVIVSGQPVDVSGSHVWISGQHVYVESGLHVVSYSGGTVHAIIDETVAGTAFQITDQSGNIARVSKRHDGIITTPDAQSEVHHGMMYQVSYCRSGLADGNDLDMFIMTASGRELHATFGMGCGGEYEGQLYENVTATDSGTPITVNNMNRFCSGQPETVFSVDPTITSTYTELWCNVGGTGGKFEHSPGTAREHTEWILTGVSGRVQYLLRVTNKAGAAKDAFISMSFSEEEPVVWW